MSLSMYQASVPGFIRSLESLSSILKKAETHAQAKKIDPSVFINARLTPDMFPFARQVQIASDSVKGCAARLTGIEVPSYADAENSFPELQERISKTIAFLKNADEKQFEGSEEREIKFTIASYEMNYTGKSYLFSFVIPNFYFHLSMAYAILRHNGVEIGKKDYMGGGR